MFFHRRAEREWRQDKAKRRQGITRLNKVLEANRAGHLATCNVSGWAMWS